MLITAPPHQMLVDDIGDVTITNDGATILKLLEVEHPAAKVCGTLGRQNCNNDGAPLLQQRDGVTTCTRYRQACSLRIAKCRNSTAF